MNMAESGLIHTVQLHSVHSYVHIYKETCHLFLCELLLFCQERTCSAINVTHFIYTYTSLTKTTPRLERTTHLLIQMTHLIQITTPRPNLFIPTASPVALNISRTAPHRDYGQPNVPPLTFFLPPNDKECTSK